jgi:predicted nucleic acid-binding protein
MKINKPAVVLDTNVLLVALPTRSPYRPFFDKLVAGAYDLVISNDIVAEYEEQIAKRYDAQTVEDLFLVLLMLPNVQRVTPYFRWRLIINDPDDDKFVDAAIVANVEHLVTNDRHFNVLKKVDFPKVNLCTAEEFLEILKKL